MALVLCYASVLHTISTSETGPKLVTKMSVLTSVTGPTNEIVVFGTKRQTNTSSKR